jgi:hypothetical protein
MMMSMITPARSTPRRGSRRRPIADPFDEPRDFVTDDEVANELTSFLKAGDAMEIEALFFQGSDESLDDPIPLGFPHVRRGGQNTKPRQLDRLSTSTMHGSASHPSLLFSPFLAVLASGMGNAVMIKEGSIGPERGHEERS